MISNNLMVEEPDWYALGRGVRVCLRVGATYYVNQEPRV